jgi:glycerol-3-phosphate dehydrogenase (NAD(P)+)
MKAHILGTGAWGRGVGRLLQGNGHTVDWISHTATAWPSDIPDFTVVAIPVQFLRETLRRFPPPAGPVLSVSKGLEIGTGYRVSQILREVWDTPRVAALTGPTLAAEIEKGLPAAAVIAAEDESLGAMLQEGFHQPTLRIYRCTDLTGAELGGALKNVYAIAGGICTGLRLGENATAALLTRCLAEMTRIGVQAGGRPETFSGLSGMGDLILTALSPQSRNHRVGAQLADGKPLDRILQEMGGVCEGVPTAKSVHLNPAISAASKPVIVAVYSILYENKRPDEAVHELMNRARTSE